MSAPSTPETARQAAAPPVPPLDAAHDPERHRGAQHKYLIAIAVVLASMIYVIDSSIVNVALPDMMGNLGASLDEVAWVSTGYILATVIIIPMTGWLGSFFGRKRYFVSSVLIFTAASFLCGQSHSLAMLVTARVIQGVGGGALMTVSQAVLFESFPIEEAGTAMALFGLGVMVGPTIGPTLGGYITDHYSWPWIFYINVPIGLLAAFMIATYVHDSPHQQRTRSIDGMGIALLVVSVGAIQYLLEQGQRLDWFNSRTVVTLAVVGVVGGGALLWRELTIERPVIDFGVLRHRQVWVGTLLGVVMGVGLYASVFTLPVFLQGDLHMTAEQTGLILLPGSAATAVAMAVIGRINRYVDPRLMVSLGALLFAASMWQLAHITSASGAGDFFWPLILRGSGLGLMFVPLTTVTLAGLPTRDLPQGTGLYNFFRQLGGSFGIAVFATLVEHYTTSVRSVLGEHVSLSDPTTVTRLHQLTAGLMAHTGDPVAAQRQAMRLLDAEMTGQASVIAFSRVYLLAAGLVLILIPLLLLIRKADVLESEGLVAME
jgi:MFS transporter, DHA2 family, multidrug resistance protein